MKKYLSVLSVYALFFFMPFAFCTCTPTVTPQWPEHTIETKPWTRWWWHGSAVDKANITANLEELAAAGFGGVEITPIYDVKGDEDKSISFQSKKWMVMFEHTLKESERLGLGVDLANASGWPFGGPWISAKHACKNVQYKKFILKEGEQLSEKIEFIQEPLVRAVGKRVDISEVKFPISSNTNLQELALDQVRFETPLPLQTLMAYNEKGETLNLTDSVNANGALNWTAPAGTWNLYAVFQGWHGKMVERAGTGGEGNVIDHFSEEALNVFLSDFDKNAENIDLTGLRAFFNDSYEVDDASGDANWTPLFFEEFQKRRGYDLRNHLPALFGDMDEETNHRVLCDYRETLSDLILEKFTKVWADWAESHNATIRNQAHGSPAAILDLYEASHIPETEGTDPMRIKMATSAAHTSGKPLVACEAATWLNEHFLSNLADVKQNADMYLTHGVNHIVYHGTPYSPIEDKWPGWMFYAAVHFAPTNTWWDELKTVNEYVANCQSFMQNAEPDNDILLYFPIYDAWTKRTKEHLPHFGMHTEDLTKEISYSLLEKGYTFDYISDKQIAKLSVENGAIKSKGATYKTILIPACEFLSLSTLQQLMKLAESGANIVFQNQIPTKVPGFNNFQAKENEVKELIQRLQFKSTQEVAIAKKGNGQVFTGSNIDLLLKEVKVLPEELSKLGLWFNRVKRIEGTCYFISNWTDKNIDQWVALNSAEEEAVWFNPMNKTFGNALTQNENKSTKVHLQLKPGETLILQSYNARVTASDYPVWESSSVKKEINNSWEITFEKGGPYLPKPLQLAELQGWESISEELAKFSGTATYLTNFELATDLPKDLLLDLGVVHESAIIKLNGTKLGTLVGPTFQIVLPKELLQTINVLEVEVTNLMANRIIDMDKNGVNYKKFYNINFAAHLRENRGEDGNFTAAHWQPLPSGLLGPVTISEITQKQIQ
ncbi:glycosyl hydrolase [uncultured Draconibacterium sp.]|uniref:glycosyl hydrolase n=1 Tax=uncultured Draconibacterium sp. TaxID=1573823 RepID=UPI0032618716